MTQNKAQLRWWPSDRDGVRPGRWVVSHDGILHFFVIWANAIYFANYAVESGIHGAPHMYEGE